jgi:2'-5' RNA ligase
VTREKPQVWRVFCAIELPEDVRSRLQEHIARLRKEFPDAAASWSRVENIHLTLKFFGNVEVNRIPKISVAATKAVKHFPKFEIDVGKTGVFPRPSRAQVLWIGVNDRSGKLSALHEKIDKECASEGFPKDERAYRPHLTIARIRKPENARQLADAHLNTNFRSIAVPLKELIVFRSELSSKGSNYTAISHHPLPDP